MTVRFIPAPGWPQPATPDWVPEPGWEPKQAGLAVQRGHKWLVDDDPRAPDPLQARGVLVAHGGTWDAVVALGVGGHVLYDGRTVVIKRTGLLGRATVGKGEKRVPLHAVSSLQLKPAGALVNGFLQVGMAGANEVRSQFGRQSFDAASDENSILFTRDAQPQFERLRDRLEADMGSRHAPQPMVASTPTRDAVEGDVIDLLRRLGELRDTGIVTEDEFTAKKAELLSRL